MQRPSGANRRAATAAIARCLVWQWLRKATSLDGGRAIDRPLLGKLTALGIRHCRVKSARRVLAAGGCWQYL
ncbi:hypothetical protein ACSMXN_22055 [Jatrophihabitans sp. DSM 45814]